MRKSKDYKNVRIKVPKYKYIISILIGMFIITIPWISYLKIINIPDSIADVFPSNKGVFIDFFLYYKEVYIIIFAVFLLLFFIGEKIFTDVIIKDYPLKDSLNRKILYLIFIFIVMLIISTVLSKYKALVLMGSPTEGEGVITYIGYMILFLGGVNYFSYDKSIKILKNSILILMLVIVAISMIEFIYKPIFEISFFRQFLGSKEFMPLINSMENRDYQNMLSLAMYNPNYLGGLAILLFPISIINIFIENKKTVKVISALISIGMIFVIFVTKSTAPVYVLLLELLFIAIYYRKLLMKNIKYTVSYFVVLLGFFVLINIITNNKVFEVVEASFKNTPSIINEKEKFLLKYITINKYDLKIEGQDETLNINMTRTEENNRLEYIFSNKNDEVIVPVIEEDIIKFNEEEFKPIHIKDLVYGIVVDIGYNDTMEFYITENGFKGVGQSGSLVEDINGGNKYLKKYLEKFYNVATGRGYTWINTLPILKDSILIGSGPGTFAKVFKQNDYVGLMNTHGSAKFLIDKPHNMYFQIWSQIGLIGLLSLIIIFGIGIKRGYQIYIVDENLEDKSEVKVGIAIFIGLIGFLILAFVNDSIVTVSPIFWILLGSNFSIMYFIKKRS